MSKTLEARENTYPHKISKINTVKISILLKKATDSLKFLSRFQNAIFKEIGEKSQIWMETPKPPIMLNNP